MSAITKTKNLGREMIPIGQLVKNADNPNRMTKREFDLLCDNIEKTGITDAILVRPIGGGQYRIVGGHHRYEAATFLGFEEVPCTIIDDPMFDEDAETFQVVRMNMIKGKMDAESFFAMFNKVASKYSDEVLADAFGFSDEVEFQKLINQAAKSLPDKMMQDQFKIAAKQVKTIDGLAQLLNEMYTKYGNTLPQGFMVLDYGGKRSVWLQVSIKTMQAIDVIGAMCIENKRTMDDVVGVLMQAIAKGEFAGQVAGLIGKTPAAEIPAGFEVLPTKEHLELVNGLTDE